MIVKLLTEHHLEFLSLKGGFRGSSESTLVKMPHCLEISCTGSIFVLPIFEWPRKTGFTVAQGPELQCPLKVKEDLS